MRSTLTSDQKNNVACLRVAEELILYSDASHVQVVKAASRRFIHARIEGAETKILVKSRLSGDWQLPYDEQADGADFYVLVDESKGSRYHYDMFKASEFVTKIHNSYATWLAEGNERNGRRPGTRLNNDDTRHTRIRDQEIAEWRSWAVASWEGDR